MIYVKIFRFLEHFLMFYSAISTQGTEMKLKRTFRQKSRYFYFIIFGLLCQFKFEVKAKITVLLFLRVHTICTGHVLGFGGFFQTIVTHFTKLGDSIHRSWYIFGTLSEKCF